MKLPGIVKCDACGWRAEVDNVFAHRESDCRDCGTPLMNDTDKTALDAVAGLMRLNLAFAPGDPKRPADTVSITIDTAKQ